LRSGVSGHQVGESVLIELSNRWHRHSISDREGALAAEVSLVVLGFEEQRQVVDRHGAEMKLVINSMSEAEVVSKDTLFQVLTHVATMGEALVKLAVREGQSVLRCFLHLAPELSVLSLIELPLRINQAVKHARHLELEHIEGGLHGDLHEEGVRWWLAAVQVLCFVDHALDTCRGGLTRSWQGQLVLSTLNEDRKRILVEFDVEVLRKSLS